MNLSSKAALCLALALHELGTNARKYGALSAEAGRVALSWQIVDGRLVIEWTETGGPRVKAPSQRGFGSRLIEQSLVSDLGAAVTLTFESTGVKCSVEIPLGRATELQRLAL